MELGFRTQGFGLRGLGLSAFGRLRVQSSRASQHFIVADAGFPSVALGVFVAVFLMVPRFIAFNSKS